MTIQPEEFVLDLVVIALIVAAVLMVTVVGVVATRRRSTPTDVVAPTRAPAPAPAAPSRLRDRLAKSRRALGDRVGALLSRDSFDSEFWLELEESLIAVDVGVAAASDVVAKVRAEGPVDAEAARAALESQLEALFAGKDRSLHHTTSPSVVLIVGVNGTGKTTSIAKLAARLQAAGHSVVLGAADTFRAAADEQLRTWAERVGVRVVSGVSGADPASVAFDALDLARSEGVDVVIVDTAGRLQSKANLMDELSKIARVLRREAGAIDEVLLVLDGTTGQNALSQAAAFTETVGVSGVVLTKLDGTAKGGIAVAVERELDIPVKFIGVGEGLDDLLPFDPHEFIDALLGE